jgi:dihydrofolate reductase
MTTVSVFVGTSVDGFIARPNGDLDFLPPGGGEPHGYNEFIATVDAIVIGRKTFETVLAMEDWPYGDKRVVVLSSRPVDLSAAGGVVEQMAGPPADIVSQLGASGAHHLYIDGGITIQGFLRAGLIQRLVITRVPVLIRSRSSSLRHTAQRRSAPSHSHSALPERPGSERVPGCRLVSRLRLSQRGLRAEHSVGS